MADSPTLSRLVARASALHVVVEQPVAAAAARYFDLLQHWNEKINLTALGDSDEAIDRLLIEPLAAAALLPRGARLLDIGSGGGSPALPLALALGASHVTMVESRGRKASFLREALRTLELAGSVETERAESLIKRGGLIHAADIISMRGVRMSAELSDSAAALIKNDGLLVMFGRDVEIVPHGFAPIKRAVLVAATHSYVHLLKPAF